MTSKYWHPVPPSLVTANSTRLGELILVDTAGFRVGMLALVQASTLPSIMLEVKGVFSKNNIELGPNDGNFKTRTNVSAYTLALGTNLSAPVQPATSTPIPDQENLSFEELPVRARRVFQVDPYGMPYTVDNPMPVAVDAVITVDNLNVHITALDNYPNPGDVHDSVRIGDGTNELKVNADGSVNVVVETSAAVSTVYNIYNEVAAVASGSPTQVVTYTIPVNTLGILQKIAYSGENIATYTVFIASLPQDVQRTYYTYFNGTFDFTSGNDSGLTLAAGTIIYLQVLHNRPIVATFDGRIQIALTTL